MQFDSTKLTDKQKEQLLCITSHERCFIEKCLFVVNKQSQRVAFLLNAAQKLYEKVQSPFDYILKSRKLGLSTRIIAGDIWACAMKKNQHAVLLSHSDDGASKLFTERVLPILKSSILPLGAQIRADHVYFPFMNSRYYVGTAGSKKFGRGDDITRYHLSEYAHWTDPSVITGIEEACVDGAIGRIETTANGTNFAHLDWKKAVAGTSRYKPVFIPWFIDPSYRIPGATISNPTEEEKKLIEAYRLTQEQLAWRREKIRSMSQPELFPQEYPSNPEEAFLSSGRMIFDWVSLLTHERSCEEEKLRGALRDMGEHIQLIPGETGNLRIWETPKTRHVYIIGADVAEGLKDGAFSAAFVMDVSTCEQVAEWHGHVAPDRFGDILALLGLYYNTALLAPEAWPGPGAVTMARLQGLGYSNVYQRPDRPNRTLEQSMGWETNVRTKPQMILSFAGAARDFQVIVRSKELVYEMRSYEYNERGEMTASLGCFSDRVIAAAIAWYVSRDIPTRPHLESQKLKHIERLVNHSGFVSAPSWRGPRCGVRPE